MSVVVWAVETFGQLGGAVMRVEQVGDDFERVEECECCEQSKIVHREQEVTL